MKTILTTIIMLLTVLSCTQCKTSKVNLLEKKIDSLEIKIENTYAISILYKKENIDWLFSCLIHSEDSSEALGTAINMIESDKRYDLKGFVISNKVITRYKK